MTPIKLATSPGEHEGVFSGHSPFAGDQLDARLHKVELRMRGYAMLSKVDDDS